MKKVIISLILVIFAYAQDNIKLAYYKSYNYEKMLDYKDAIKTLIPIYKKYPNDYTLNLRLGYLFFLNKNYNNSISHYTKASNILPYSIEPKLGLIRDYLKMGKSDNALTIANSIIKIDYYNYYGNLYLLKALKLKNNYIQAKEVANKILTLYPTDVLFLLELAKITYIDNPKDAKIIFKNILILDPNNITAKEYLNK